MTVHDASELAIGQRLRVLLLGAPKIGKTGMCVASSPGPVRVFLCESDSALQFASALRPDFSFARTPTHDVMLEEMLQTRKDARKGRVKTLIVDPMTSLAARLEDYCYRVTPKDRNGNDQPMKVYPMYKRILRQLCEQLLDLPCNVIVIMHYIEKGEIQLGAGGTQGTARSGEGIVPNLAGAAREDIPALFPNIIWMDYENGKRRIVTGSQGLWGPGCRGLKGTRTIPAEVCVMVKDPNTGEMIPELKPMKRLKKNGIYALIRAFKHDAPKRAHNDDNK
jgi:hypothetical protein